MKFGCPLLILTAAFVGSAALGDAPPSVAETLTLSGGRVLHHVRVLSDEQDSLVVYCDEGMIKVPKSSLPGATQAAPTKAPAQAMVMQAFNPNPSSEIANAPTPRPTPTPRPMPTSPPQRLVFKGCTLVSFVPKPYRDVLGCAEVVIRNETDGPVGIEPNDLMCTTQNGRRYRGRILVTDGYPPVVKHNEVIPPNGEITDLVTFTNTSIEIASVQWSR